MKEAARGLFKAFLRPGLSTFLSTVLLFSLSLVASLLNAIYLKNEGIEIAAFSFLGLSAAYLAYAVIRYGVSFYKRRIVPKMDASRISGVFSGARGGRIVFFSLGSSLINVGYAALHLAMAIIYSSFWYGSSAAYLLLLAALRASTIASSFHLASKTDLSGDELEKAKRKIALVEASLLLPFDLAMGGSITAMIVEGPPRVEGTIYAIAFAAYAFFKLIAAFFHLAEARKGNDPIISTLRMLSLSDALMSMVSLTVIMDSTFSEPETELIWIKALVGFASVIVTAALAVFAIMKNAKRPTAALP